jgi:ubiquinone biosynthesis protein
MPTAHNPISKVTQAYRHVERITELMKVMVKFGFGDLFATMGLGDVILKVKRVMGVSKIDSSPYSRAKRLRLALEEMGLVYIKLGQYLSTRHDVLPLSYVEEFAKLQDSVPPIGFEDFKKIIKDNLDEGLFKEIEETPLAAASVGQVHAAILNDGREVVLKVQRPGLRKQVQTDMEIIQYLAGQAEKFIPALNFLHPSDMVLEFRKSILTELNYRQETNNILHFNRLYAGSKEVKIPALIRELTSDAIIVMERLKGVKFDDKEGLIKAGINIRALARLTSKVALEQIMSFGFFHADPHPGNLFAQPGPVVAFMDFGQIGRLSSNIRDELLKLALGAVRNKPSVIAKAVLRLATPGGETDRDRLETDISHLLDFHLSGTLKDINLNAFLRDILDVCSQHELRVPPELLLLVKSLVQFERLGILLDQNFDVITEIKPVVTSIYMERYSPQKRVGQIIRDGEEAIYSLQNLPRDMAPFLKMLKSGILKGDVNIANLFHINSAINKASQRLSFAIVLASLLIGSSWIIAAKVPPLWYGVSVMGLIGLFGALILALWLLVDYIKEKE